jgi:hypothetical protein
MYPFDFAQGKDFGFNRKDTEALRIILMCL